MKRFWLVLPSLMLMVAFNTSAFAVDVKVSGEFMVGGMYLDKTTLKKDTATDGPSTAFYFQRLRVRTDFVVSPGLTLTTRADIMERAWGAARSAPGIPLDTQSSGTRAENENIAFDYAYVTYQSPIGIFAAGIQPNSTWGTVFGNSEQPIGKISYTLPIGDFTFIAQLIKAAELSTTAINPAGYADADANYLYLMGLYRWKQGIAGVIYIYGNDATKRPDALGGYRTHYDFWLMPYAVAQLGPVKVQAELQYVMGKREYETVGQNLDISNWAGWVDATVTFKPVYFGATFAYVAGDDPNTTDKLEGGVLTGGNDWNPCLILWSYDRGYWGGALNGQGTSTNGTAMTNAFFYQVRAGVMPIDKLDIMASVSYAYADKKPTGYESDKYGWEVDLTGTYKITNNLSYMLGAGYLFTGDYFKGATTGNITNDLLVINKLTLTF